MGQLAVTLPGGDLTQIRDVARDIARDVMAADAERVDREACWPERGIRTLQSAGLGGLTVPERNGGLGHGLLALAQVCEIIAQECSSSALCYGMHCVGTAVLAAKATADQQHRYLEPIARGEHLTTIALSEPGSGAHFYLPETRLAQAGPHVFHVSGTKTFVTNGAHADSYVVSTVAADPNAPPGQFSCVVVPEGARGMTWGDPWNGIGMRGNSSRTLELRDVPVPDHDLLGEIGDQIWYIFEVVTPYFLIAMAGTYLGIATAALEQARDHISRRQYTLSGSSPGQQPVVQHRLGVLWSQVERTRQLIYHAASLGDVGDAGALLALSAAKAESAVCAVDVVNEAMTLAGGVAYRENSRLARLLRDARAGHVMTPTTDILQTWIGRALLGAPLLSE